MKPIKLDKISKSCCAFLSNCQIVGCCLYLNKANQIRNKYIWLLLCVSVGRPYQIVKLWGIAYICTRLIKLEANISDYCCASQSGVHPARGDRLSYRSLVLLWGQICNSINQLDVSLFGETDKSGNLTRLAFFTFLLYKHLFNTIICYKTHSSIHEIDM